jgi:superfamily I DNA/RNA helicase
MEVQEYVNHDPSGSELSLMVNLIDEFGTDVIIHSLDECVTEAKASLVISTAHKSKGREWDKVRLAGDFPTGIDKNGEPTNVGDEELRLLYVAGTRACLHLDTAGNPLFEA